MEDLEKKYDDLHQEHLRLKESVKDLSTRLNEALNRLEMAESNHSEVAERHRKRFDDLESEKAPLGLYLQNRVKNVEDRLSVLENTGK